MTPGEFPHHDEVTPLFARDRTFKNGRRFVSPGTVEASSFTSKLICLRSRFHSVIFVRRQGPIRRLTAMPKCCPT